MGQTVNLLAYAFGGSNPSLPTLWLRLKSLEAERGGRGDADDGRAHAHRRDGL